MALRPLLSEMGCLPVSSMLAIPKAQEARTLCVCAGVPGAG
jgi:hypothetical protein